MKFIALYIRNIFKNTKISNNYLVKHEIILQIFISFNSEFRQFIKFDHRFVYYIIFTFVSYRLVSISLGFASILFYFVSGRVVFLFHEPTRLSQNDRKSKAQRTKGKRFPLLYDDNIFALYITLLRHCSGNFTTLCCNVKRAVTAKQNICAILYRCFPAVQSSSPYGTYTVHVTRVPRVRRCNIYRGLHVLIIVTDNAPIKINRISTV